MSERGESVRGMRAHRGPLDDRLVDSLERDADGRRPDTADAPGTGNVAHQEELFNQNIHMGGESARSADVTAGRADESGRRLTVNRKAVHSHPLTMVPVVVGLTRSVCQPTQIPVRLLNISGR
jgi:hypothetical protein